MDGPETSDFNDAMDEECYEILDELPWENQQDDDVGCDNEYVKNLVRSSSLKLLQEERIRRAYEASDVLGLFKLFWSRSFLDKIRKWTNQSLLEDGKKEISESRFNAYIGLEIALSLIKYNDIDEYWREQMFQGHADLKKTLSRDEFSSIRSHLRLRPPVYCHDGAHTDPLWNSRSLMEYFSK